CLIASMALPGRLYQSLCWGQITFYALGLAGMVQGSWKAIGCQSRAANVAASFLVLNAAAWIAFWVWLSGKADQSWHKVSYDAKPVRRPAARALVWGSGKWATP